MGQEQHCSKKHCNDPGAYLYLLQVTAEGADDDVGDESEGDAHGISKNELRPMPLACARGRFARSPARIAHRRRNSGAIQRTPYDTPMGSEPPSKGFANILSLNIKIYTITKNMVIPAMNSALTQVPHSFSLKSFSFVFLLTDLFH